MDDSELVEDQQSISEILDYEPSESDNQSEVIQDEKEEEITEQNSDIEVIEGNVKVIHPSSNSRTIQH